MKVLALVDHLRDVGFSLGLGDHVRAQTVAARVAGDLERTRSVLRAVLVRDRADNDRFNTAFDLFFTDDPLPSIPPLPPAPPPEPVAKAVGRVLVVPAAVVLAVVAVAMVAMYALRPEPPALGKLAPRKPPPPERPGYCPEPDTRRDRQLVPFTRETRPLAWSGAALVAGGLALAIFGARRARRRARSHRDRFLRGPWDWQLPIAPHERTPVFTRDDIHRAAALLARAHDHDRRRVSLRETVIATARRGGFPTLVHRPADRAPTVGFVLDASPSAAPWRVSATDLVERLRKTGAPVRVWWYRNDVRRVSRTPRGDAEVSLGSLHAEVDALVIVGEPDVSLRDIAPALRRFPRKLWLHPLPPSRWSADERALAEVIPMEHASIAALAHLAQGHADAVFDAGAPWTREAALFPGSPDGVAALEAYLGAGFAWLCAAAVARRPERDGLRLLGPMLGPSRLPWSAWLRLATLPWFDHDEWPEALRDELLRRLPAEARRAMRTELLRRMESAAEVPPQESSAWWQRELDLSTLEHDLGRENIPREAELMASPMRPAVVAGGRRVRMYARAITWQRAGAELAVAGLGASVVAGGVLAWRTRETVTEHRETWVQRPPRMVPCQRPDCPEGMVYIPEGEFMMGSPEGESEAGENERPQHRVHLSAFCIDRTEVSVAAFRAYWSAGHPAVTGGRSRTQAGAWWSIRSRASHLHNGPDAHGTPSQGDARTTRSTAWTGTRRRRSARGVAGVCQRKRNGSTPREAPTAVCTHGATNHPMRRASTCAARSATCRTRSLAGTTASLRSRPSSISPQAPRPLVCWAWRATSGSGSRMGTQVTQPVLGPAALTILLWLTELPACSAAGRGTTSIRRWRARLFATGSIRATSSTTTASAAPGIRQLPLSLDSSFPVRRFELTCERVEQRPWFARVSARRFRSPFHVTPPLAEGIYAHEATVDVVGAPRVDEDASARLCEEERSRILSSAGK